MPRPAGPGWRRREAGQCGDDGQAEGRGQRQQHAVEQPGDARRRLVLHEVEQGRDQREARHQEQHRRDEAHRMGEREGADAEAQHDQAIDARCEHGAQRRHGVLVEPLARQQGARGLSQAAADGGGPGRQHVAAVQVRKAGRGDRHRERDRQQGVQRGRGLDGVDLGGQRLGVRPGLLVRASRSSAAMREASTPSGATSRVSVTVSPPACAVAVMPPMVMCTARCSMPSALATRPMASRTRKAVSPDRSIAAPKRRTTSREWVRLIAGSAPLRGAHASGDDRATEWRAPSDDIKPCAAPALRRCPCGRARPVRHRS